VNLLRLASRAVPDAYRANFRHLYFDIAWYGVLAASAISFVSVYAARLGGSAFQIGLLSAGPAVVNLVVTLPAARWLRDRPLNPAVARASALHRVWYLLWIFLPWLLPPGVQVWALVGLTLLMSAPGALLAVGFNALFAEAVPPAWRGQVAGVRNALLSVTFILVSLLCGAILDRMAFPLGYQVVFAVGFVGAALSTLHLWLIKPEPHAPPRPRTGRSLGDLASPGRFRSPVDGVRLGAGLRFLIARPHRPFLAADVLRGPFGRLIAVLFAFHVALHVAIPLFPLTWVNRIQLNDQEIGLGTAVFYVCVFAGSTQLARLVQRLGNQRVTALGAVFMSSYPAWMAVSRGLGGFLVGSAFGGLGWALAGGAMVNYVLEKVPEDRRPDYLAWYNLALNAALLVGALTGPLLAGIIGVPATLLLSAALRFLGALAILRWG
jgi:MFS family permease